MRCGGCTTRVRAALRPPRSSHIARLHHWRPSPVCSSILQASSRTRAISEASFRGASRFPSSSKKVSTMADADGKHSATSAVASPPPISHVLETCLMVKDIKTCTSFYSKVFNIEPFLNTPRMSGFALSQTTLLLFQLGATAADSPMPDNRGTIPGHGPTKDVLDVLLSSQEGEGAPDSPTASLHHHFCLAVKSADDVQAWDQWLDKNDVKITGRVHWPRGGRSVYFADPEGNVGEIASRGIWEHY